MAPQSQSPAPANQASMTCGIIIIKHVGGGCWDTVFEYLVLL